MEIADKYYEELSTTKSADYNNIINALEIIKKYIIREKRILTGGMSIDFALKLKGKKGIYADDALPDYDFFSPQHFADAYEIATWLYRIGFRDISVINALHPSTIKVRINFVTIADITYVPSSILEQMPTLKYKGFTIIHPHVQMIDQHRALCYPYENAPRETIMGGRPKKDMKRHDLLYEYYPLRLLGVEKYDIKMREYKIKKEILKAQCITGFLALNYWINIAREIGFNIKNELGDCVIDENYIKCSIPMDAHGITMYSDNINELYKMIKNVYNPKEERFYNKFLDKLPRKIILDNQWEFLENNNMISAENIGEDIFIANLQNIMMYFLTNYILLRKLKKAPRGYSFYLGYLKCRDLIQWAASLYYNTTRPDIKKKLKQFLPTANIYGSYNKSESFIVNDHNFSIKNGDIPNDKKYAQPNHVYDRDLKYNKVPSKYYDFDVKKSEIFNFDGEEINNFIS